ncbi:MAG: MFS transporter [Fimbriimonadales bacterium]|nr:MFS transporter [Fimbriimonadales bacterium]MDW8052480.1 MFS transporter [Armatimonadota bacterium]
MRAPTDTPRGGAGVWLALGWVALVAFIDTFAIVPILAPYAKRVLSASDAQAGLAISLYSLANLLTNLYSGVLIDRYGRRLPMALSLWGAGGLIALYPLARTPEALMVLRALHGATSAVFVPALFALVGEYGKANRMGAMGSTGALIGLVALLAPPLGGIVVRDYGESTLFWGVAGLMAIAGFAALYLRELPYPPRAAEQVMPLELWRISALRATFLLTLAITFMMGVLLFALPVRLEQAGYDAATRGRLFGLLALVAMVLMAVLRRAHLLGGTLLRAQIGVGTMALGALGLSFASTPLEMGVVAVVYGVGFGLTFPAVHVAAFEHAPSHRRGTSLAMLHACYSLGYVLGPAAAGMAGAAGAGSVGALVGTALLLGAVYTCSRASRCQA